MPIVDIESGQLQVKSLGGNDYVKVYDSVLNATVWKVWDYPPSSESMSLLMPAALSGGQDGMMPSSSPLGGNHDEDGTDDDDKAAASATTSLLPKLGGVAPSNQMVSSTQHTSVSTGTDNQGEQTTSGNEEAVMDKGDDASTSSFSSVSGASRSSSSSRAAIIYSISLLMIAILWRY